MALISSELTEHQHPGIARAALEMSYANGGINRDRSEADVLSDLNVTLAIVEGFKLDLGAIDKWLGGLSEDDLLTVVDGEETETDALTAKAPAGTQSLLNAIFHGAA
jgi:hypothetical protein